MEHDLRGLATASFYGHALNGSMYQQYMDTEAIEAISNQIPS